MKTTISPSNRNRGLLSTARIAIIAIRGDKIDDDNLDVTQRLQPAARPSAGRNTRHRRSLQLL
jgi:hypothetical protein